MRRRLQGFTVIELLIVVAIIAVLVSMSFPVGSSILRNSRCMTCQANERDLLAATFRYVSDNGGLLPLPSQIGETPQNNGANVTWAMDDTGVADFNVGSLLPYIAATPERRAIILWCPSDDKECLPTVGGPVQCDRNFSYSMNQNIRASNWGNDHYGNWIQFPPAQTLRQVNHQAEHVWVYEEFGPNDGINWGPSDGDDWLTGRHGPYGTTQYRSNYGSAEWRASGMGNVGYFDGHVAMMSVEFYFAPVPQGAVSHWGPLQQ